MCATTRPPQCRITGNRARRAFPALCHTSLPCSNPEELEAAQSLEKERKGKTVKKRTTAHSPESGLSLEQGEALTCVRE